MFLLPFHFWANFFHTLNTVGCYLLGIVAKICFHYSANLSNMITFHFPWNRPKNHDFRGNKKQFTRSHLIMEAKFGDNPILLFTRTRLLPCLLFLRHVLGVDHSKDSGVPSKVIRFSLPTSLNKLFSTWPLLDGASPKHLL